MIILFNFHNSNLGRYWNVFGYDPHAYGGGGQNLLRRNVERSIFQNFKIVNIKMTKDELFDSFIAEFIFFIFYKLFE